MDLKELLLPIGTLFSMALLVHIAFSPGPRDITEDSPPATVLRAFNAYTAADVKGVNAELSQQGFASAEFFCGGLAIACLAENYGRLGSNKSVKLGIMQKTDTAATVTLKTTWENYPKALCQKYAVNNTDKGWRITYFDNPEEC